MQTDKILGNFWARNILISLMVGTLLGLSGAFGTYELGSISALIYWITTIFMGSMIARLTSDNLDKISSLEERPILYHAIHLTIITILITLLVVITNNLFFGLHLNSAAYLGFLPVVFVVSMFMSAIHWAFSQVPKQTHEIKGQSKTDAEVALLARLPFKFKKAEIIAINAEDHYLRVHTNIGDTMILMRLYDAIKELEGIEGSQTHRSWWVAKDAITETMKGDGRTNFKLKNGAVAPVSRSFLNVLRAQNWL